ncbi:hypothetical protein CLIB1444_10S03246 [[Candida] jaroonii]|uniref:Uncharacterized protein n=1 Tax=[Candida] jaroonii TaxID=467808 RepID=A0ACA9YCK0_9ASCO|nr:hypothetical protein CLIB1444_10S03246 [[Candida] jaroonii]
MNRGFIVNYWTLCIVILVSSIKLLSTSESCGVTFIDYFNWKQDGVNEMKFFNQMVWQSIGEVRSGKETLELNCTEISVNCSDPAQLVFIVPNTTSLVVFKSQSPHEFTKKDLLIQQTDVTRENFFLDSIELSSYKYFKEIDTHFDARFYKKSDFSTYERIASLHKLTRSWLKFSNSINLNSWLSHGTLLGWYWNKMNLPWDNDLDIQLPIREFENLLSFNQSLIFVEGTYLLDLNPHWTDRNDSLNNIDGRFIDIETGFYVDLTTLAFTDNHNLTNSIEFKRFLDDEFLEKEGSTTIIKSELNKSLEREKLQLHKAQNMFNCKDNHYYKFEELFPLKQTTFEGVEAWVPRKYKTILLREYNKGIYSTYFNGFSYDKVKRLWISEKCDKTCKIETDIRYDLTKNATSLYYNLYGNPWMISEYKKR